LRSGLRDTLLLMAPWTWQGEGSRAGAANPMTAKTSRHRRFEQLVHRIQAELSPDAVVEHDVKLRGLTTHVPRQIDVLVTKRVEPATLRIVIECKDHKRSLSVKQVESAIALAKDVGANHLIVASSSGFSHAAQTLAAAKGVQLFRVWATGEPEWALSAFWPTLVQHESVCVRAIAITRADDGPPILLELDALLALSLAEPELAGAATISELAHNVVAGVSSISDQPLSGGGPVRVLIDGCDVEANVEIRFAATRRWFFGAWRIVDLAALEVVELGTEAWIAPHLAAEGLTVEAITSTWHELSDPRACPCTPFIQLHIREMSPYRTLVVVAYSDGVWLDSKQVPVVAAPMGTDAMLSVSPASAGALVPTPDAVVQSAFEIEPSAMFRVTIP